MNWIREIMPILGIGLIFAVVYELVLLLSQKLIENDDKVKEKKEKKIINVKFFYGSKNQKIIA
ncbi:hypothetical protein [Lactococcus cremoris]|uniref:Uncharacterized protein n=1 Tax=Lactococcus lactis subsp. cremoris TaxID=1359 RepID=A0AAD1JX10_LACLC|nr:hypothetical protein [Lactococcus cremoris]MBU8904571.1 hypothetical protein [Lactococcus cremoris]MCT0467208.1 hypothetical protein [Lactococcus cremoris]MCT0487742.1 hypothetical protein [Lactococcus cremoris]MCT4431691.1 hypothetical protein [Lactococcus cremoris]MCT4454519.1 hypothetical protein [Lactococcus cremoris]